MGNSKRKNNAYFTLEKSTDGVHWLTIATVNGAGNSTSSNIYNIIDEKIELGNNYYRLSQTDFDGTSETFPPISLNYSKNEISIYPNSVTSVLNIQGASENSIITVIDIKGNIVLISNSTKQLNLNKLEKGVYFILIKEQSFEFKQRILKI